VFSTVLCHGRCSRTTPTAHGSEVAISRAGAINVLWTEGIGLIIFFTSEETELADLLSDETWCNKVAFRADISQALNSLSKSMQGKNENILTCTDKFNSFEDKLTLGGAKIRKESTVQMFELTKSCRLDKNLVDLIL
jgi:hypothetical protein